MEIGRSFVEKHGSRLMRYKVWDDLFVIGKRPKTDAPVARPKREYTWSWF